MINTEFLIVDKRVSPILGLKSCNSFGLVKRANISEIKSVNNEYVERDKFIKEHKIIFEGIGTFPNKYKIKVLDNVVGVINPPKRVPQTILKRLKVELVKLEKNKIIEKVLEPKDIMQDYFVRICHKNISCCTCFKIGQNLILV